ncbi:MAG: M48 family metalloprotease [Kofleriaceae bacterium]
MRLLLVIGVGLALVACPPPAPTTPRPVADPRAGIDPINRVNVAQLRAHTQTILGELVAALPDERRASVANYDLQFDNALGDVNAYATCGEGGAPIVAVSDGMLLIVAHLAMSTATDQVFESEKRSQYLDWISEHGVKPPPPGFYAPAYHTDRSKVLRQRELFDEQVAFILGHELAHHYLGHLGCGELQLGVLPDVPMFEQAEELSADVAAVRNLLTAGKRRAGYEWTEAGALLVLAAFHARMEITVRAVVFAFERTHPLPALRMPLITTTADLWKLTSEYTPI